MTHHYLEPLFAPTSVAVVGASERPDSLGRDVFKNLIDGDFKGHQDRLAQSLLVAVNPKHRTIFGRPCYPSVGAIGKPIDLIVVTTPASAVPAVLEDAARAGVKHAVVLAAGFGEIGPTGVALEGQLREQARALGIRMIGPNCLGIMRPSIGLNATFGRTPARAGPIALVSQSGAICTALVDWAWAAGFGFSSVVSMGAAIDVDIGEILDYLLYDPNTHSILLYLEGVRDARRFVSGLRAAARSKPIVVVKVGRHAPGMKAARSHTGALVGNDAVFDAALRRSGVVRVQTYAELFAVARLLATDRLPVGNRLAILTNGGGPGVMAADAAADRGVPLAELGPISLAALDQQLPSNWSHGNPIDILGDATRERFVNALDAVLADPAVDGVLTLFCPQALTSSLEAARALLPAARKSTKPVLTGWLGEHEVRDGRSLIEAAGMPAFSSPESGVYAFAAIAEYAHAQQLLLEVPPPLASAAPPDTDLAFRLFDALVAESRTMMTEPEAKQLLACFGIPTTTTVHATTIAATLSAAEHIGYPVVLKILSRDIAHKSDVQGVCLNIRDATSLEREFHALMARVGAARPTARIDGVAVQTMVEKRFARELMIGVATDPVFGPVISFGSGGVAVELVADNAIGLPPLSARLASALIDRTRVARLLGAYRHIPAARRDDIVDILLRVSDMVTSLPWLAELDINPLLVDDRGAIAVDARVVINPAQRSTDRRYSYLAIHPYPARLEGMAQLKDGARLQIRPIRPEDATMELAFVAGLSDQSRYLRFFNSTRAVSPKMLARLTQVDYDRELALVAIERDDRGQDAIVGVSRYVSLPDAKSCEFAVSVGERWQNRGLGYALMTRLIDAAREAGLARIEGQVLTVNAGMLQLSRALGFKSQLNREEPTIVDVALDMTL